MEYNHRKHDLSNKNLITVTVTVDGAVEAVGPGTLSPAMGKIPESWDLEADVVIIGSGGGRGCRLQLKQPAKARR